MTKERKLEKIRISSYEVLCIMRSCTPEERNNFVKKIRESVSLEDLVTKSEVRELAYPIEEMKTAEYLLLNFKIEREKISKIEEVLKNPLIIRHLTINLDTEKKIRIKNSDKLQRNRRFRKSGIKTEKSLQEKSGKEVTQEDASQSGVNN